MSCVPSLAAEPNLSKALDYHQEAEKKIKEYQYSTAKSLLISASELMIQIMKTSKNVALVRSLKSRMPILLTKVRLSAPYTDA